MKKVFYGLFFFLLTFLSVNVVRAEDRYCSYTIDGTNSTIVARIGSDEVYIDYTNATGKGGTYPYNLTNYNVFDYVEKNNKCPKYAYRFKTPVYQDGKKLDINSHYEYRYIFTDSNIKTVQLKNTNKDVMDIEDTFTLSSNESSKSLSCSFVNPKTGDVKFKYSYSSGKETYTFSNKTITPKIDSNQTLIRPYQKNKCPQFIIYNSSTNKLDLYYDGNTEKDVGTDIISSLDNLYVLKDTPMAYCAYGVATAGYIGSTPFAVGSANNNVDQLFTVSGFQDTEGLPTCLERVYYYTTTSGGSVGLQHTYVTPTLVDKENSKHSELNGSLSFTYSTKNNNYKSKLSCEYTRDKNLSTYPSKVIINLYTNGNITAYGDKDELSNNDSGVSSQMQSGTCPENVWVDSCGSNKCVYSSKTGVKYKYVQTGLTSEDYKATGDIYTGVRFKELMQILYPYLIEIEADKIPVSDNGSTYTPGMVYFSGKKLAISNWGMSGKYTCTSSDCMNNFDYELTTKIKDVAVYCNDLYNRYNTAIAGNLNDQLKLRLQECISFDYFYEWLADNGKINRFDGNCGFISQDVYDMIQTALNIIKIAGPILAIGLGMLDFVKAVVATDADKELKTAWQRFIKRVIAAVILLLLPIILSFLMNIFLKGEDGYDSENPFCNLENMHDLEK